MTARWSDSLPPSWSVAPLKAVIDYRVSNVDKVRADDEMPVRLCNYTDVYKNEFITPDLDFMPGTAHAGEVEKFKLEPGDVLITKDSESWDDIGVPALVLESAADLLCGYHLALLRPRTGILDGEFLLRCLQAKPIRLQLELAANGITRFGLSIDDIGRMNLPVPPLLEQRALARYLHGELSRIDRLLTSKEEFIILLAEKRRAVIARVVMSGIDASAPMQDSGIEWLGSIPRHWRIERAKWLLDERDERSTTGEEVLLSLRMERGLVPHNDVSDNPVTSDGLIGYKKTATDEIVLNRMRAASGLVAVSPQDGLVSPDYAVFRCRNDAHPHYYGYLFRTDVLQSVFRSESTGLGTGSSGFLRLYSENFLSLWLPSPPHDEQLRIVEHIRKTTGELDELSAATLRSIELLKERRAALITSVVTGETRVD